MVGRSSSQSRMDGARVSLSPVKAAGAEPWELDRVGTKAGVDPQSGGGDGVYLQMQRAHARSAHMDMA